MESKFYLKTDKALDLLTDEQLIEEIRNKNENALDFLMNKYKAFVYSCAKSYFLVGGEKQDIIQEGLIGLFKAIKNFDNDKQNSFRIFADLCIRRQIISAIKTSTRQKQLPLNNCLSLNTGYDCEDNDKSLVEVLENDVSPDPSETIVNRETFFYIKTKMNKILSEFEQTVLDKYLCGYTYTQIASVLKAEPKSVDNAIQRIKKKMQRDIYSDKELY